MRKHHILVFILAICFITVSGVFAACGDKKENIQKYTVSFYDGKTLVDTIDTAGNEKLSLPSAPLKTGYTFYGWFFDEDVWENELKEDTYAHQALTQDVDVYAYYVQNEEPQPPEQKEYTITFYIGEEINGTLKTSGNEGLVLPSAPQKEGYTFIGWFFDKDSWQNRLTENTYKEQALSENVSVYAYYKKEEAEKPAEFAVHFELNGGSGVSDVTVSEIATEPQPLKEGYAFKGWYKESNFVNQVVFPYQVTAAQTLYAKWEKNRYTVKFITNGGTPLEDRTVSVIDESPETTKEGFAFDGWYTEDIFENKVEFPYEVVKEQTLYAKWIENGPEDVVFTVDGSGVLTGVDGLNQSDMRVEIPSVVNGVTVKEIGSAVFKGNQNLGVLIIPDSVRILGYQMCRGCTNLKEVVLPSGLTVIPDETFDGCSSLEKVDFPSSLKEIRSDAFWGTALTEFIAPESLDSVWTYAFKGCEKLERVDLKNVKKISFGAFQECTALKSIKLPDSLVSLTGSIDVFSGCTSLSEIDMPDKPVSVSSSIFNNTGYYNDPKNWENGVLFADGYLIVAGKDFSSVTEYFVPQGTIVIAEGAFNDKAPKLQHVSLPDSVLRIGREAFAKCGALVKIDMNESIRFVGYNAFINTGYYLNGANWTDNGLYIGNWLVSVKNIEMASFTVQEGTIGVADGKDTALFPTKAQKITKLILPDSLKYIGVRSFARLRITDLQLPAGLKVISEGAFASCPNLKTVNLGECTQLEEIGDSAFTQAALTEVEVPAGVVRMGELIFNHNTVDLVIKCQLSSKPEGWDKNWAYSYREGVTVKVEWKQ